MNRIEEMIKEMCPDGVRRVRLGDVCEVCRGKRVVRKELADTGVIPVFQNSLKPLGYYDKSNYPSNTPYIISAGGAGDVGFSVLPFWAADDCFVILSSNLLLSNFIYFILKTKEIYFKSQIRGGAIKRLPKDIVVDLQIPLPPLPIQQEIVKILDSFTALQQNLEDELKLRQKQYEHYREKLLTFEDGEVEWKKLGEVAEIGTGSRNTQDGLQEGMYPFYTRGQEVLRMNTYDYNETAIITAGDGAGVGKTFHFVSGCYALHQRAYRFVPNVEIMVPKFLYYYIIHSFYSYIMKNSVVGSVPSVRKPMLEKYIIPVPTIETQLQITQTLDHFESLISNIKTEIELRKKQYEYYREKLLTF